MGQAHDEKEQTLNQLLIGSPLPFPELSIQFTPNEHLKHTSLLLAMGHVAHTCDQGQPPHSWSHWPQKWTGSTPAPALSFWPPPIARTSSTPPCCVPADSTAGQGLDTRYPGVQPVRWAYDI
jgi:hypothetical protein